MNYRPPKKRESHDIGPRDYSAEKIDENEYKDSRREIISKEEEREKKEGAEGENERITVKKEIISLLKYLPLLVIIGASVIIVGNLFPEYIGIIVLGGLALVMVSLWLQERLRIW